MNSATASFAGTNWQQQHKHKQPQPAPITGNSSLLQMAVKEEIFQCMNLNSTQQTCFQHSAPQN